MSSTPAPLVGVIMGSRSDLETMQAAIDVLEELGIPYEARIISAHRTPDEMFEYARTAQTIHAAIRSGPLGLREEIEWP